MPARTHRRRNLKKRTNVRNRTKRYTRRNTKRNVRRNTKRNVRRNTKRNVKRARRYTRKFGGDWLDKSRHATEGHIKHADPAKGPITKVAEKLAGNTGANTVRGIREDLKKGARVVRDVGRASGNIAFGLGAGMLSAMEGVGLQA